MILMNSYQGGFKIITCGQLQDEGTNLVAKFSLRKYYDIETNTVFLGVSQSLIDPLVGLESAHSHTHTHTYTLDYLRKFLII